MKNLLLLFILLLSVLGCAPELVMPDDPKEESENITDSIHDLEPGSKDSVWLEGGKVTLVPVIRVLVARYQKAHKGGDPDQKAYKTGAIVKVCPA